MESVIEIKSAPSLSQHCYDWLTSKVDFPIQNIVPLPGDAGFRRYYRIFGIDQTMIAVDASESHENCHAFVAIAQGLARAKVKTPHVFAYDLKQRFLLLSDFGDVTFFKALMADMQSSAQLYPQALQKLIRMRECTSFADYSLPAFTSHFMWQEWLWHREWFSQKWLQLTLPQSLEQALDRTMIQIIDLISMQPQTFMHRDYHSMNLMVLPNQEIGVLDFQDAFLGPITYDVVSLLRDCYITLPTTQVQALIQAYKHEVLPMVNDEEFLQWIDMMSMQRHLKALLTFARKHVRDQQPGYLKYVPRTMQYLLNVAHQHPQLAAMTLYLQEYVVPALAQENIVCEQ